MKGFKFISFSIFALALNLLIINSSLSYIGDADQFRSQAIAKRYLRKIHASLWAWLDPTAYNGLTSSFISNLRQLPKSKLDKNGYKEIFITTKDKKVSRFFIKMENEKRPLIVFVSGLSSPADANYFSHYALPANKYFGFNVAMVENSTAADFGKRNMTIQSSGYEAGWDLYLKLLELKRHPDVAPYVSEVHLVGISLGGSDLSFATYFDSIMKTNVIDGGVLNVSSPADRLNSFKELRQTSGPTAIAVNEMFRRTYGDGRVYKKYTDHDFYWIFWGAKFEEVFNEIYLKSANEYFTKNPYHFNLIEHTGNGELKESELLRLFDLGSFLPEITKPILWIQSIDDPVVKFDTNGGYIENLKNDQFDVYATNYGGHAGHPQAYGGVWVMEHIFTYIQYWGKFPSEYYSQWKKPYEHKFLFSRYLKNS